jgi:mono/diheme cytochrome c family protein
MHKAVDKNISQGARRSRSALCILLFAFCLLPSIGCRTDMQDQPKMKPYRSSTFFNDGLSSRPLVEGTVPRGFLKTDTEYFTGKKAGRGSTGAALAVPAGPQPSATRSTSSTASTVGTAPTGAAAYPDDVEVFPIPVTKEMIIRGKQRYEIFCSACHGPTGDGDGMIVRRGFRRAASFNDDRLRQAPVGHFFDAVTNGWGAMPSYAPQIPVQDRWAIIAYIRALQLKNEMQTPTQTSTAPAAATSQGGRHQ